MRYRVDWSTWITEDRDGVRYQHPVRGFTILEAEDIEEARSIADNLTDVDFFVPGRTYSASDPAVVSGAMWNPEAASPMAHHDLWGLLPDTEEWTFDTVAIIAVTPL